MRRRSCGISGRNFWMGAGSSLAIIIANATMLSDLNGGWPESIWYRMMPTENRSERPSTLEPLVCSGDMYCGVPSTSPTRVSLAAPDEVTCAMPKSVTLTSCAPETHMMFDGLMSRCTTPLLCA